MIDTVIFDIGNVLVDFDWHAYMRSLFQDDDVIDAVSYAIWKTGYWDDLDRGADTDETFSKMLKARPGYEEEIRKAFDEVGVCTVRCSYAIPWITSLKERGLRVLYLSNYSPHTMASNPEALDFVPVMDGGVFSCDVRINKPDPGIYRCLIGKYDLDPGTCVFTDDKQVNVDTAVSLGMKGLVFSDYETARKELEYMICMV